MLELMGLLAFSLILVMVRIQNTQRSTKPRDRRISRPQRLTYTSWESIGRAISLELNYLSARLTACSMITFIERLEEIREIKIELGELRGAICIFDNDDLPIFKQIYNQFEEVSWKIMQIERELERDLEEKSKEVKFESFY